MQLTILEELVRKLECSEKKLGVMKECLAKIKAVLGEHNRVRHQFSDAVSKLYNLQRDDSDDKFTNYSQVLLVNLPSEKEKA